MAQDNKDEIFLEDLGNKSKGPWKAIALVVFATLVAIWLVPGEERPQQVNQPISEVAPGPVADKPANRPAGAQTAPANTDSQTQPELVAKPAKNTEVSGVPTTAPESPATQGQTPEIARVQPKPATISTPDTRPEANNMATPANDVGLASPDTLPEEAQDAPAQPNTAGPVAQNPASATGTTASVDLAARTGQPPVLPVRELIRQLDAGKADDLAFAFSQGGQYLAQGKSEDAYLLYFFAARNGHQEAAYTLAQHADPAYHQADGLLPQADVRQALKWYRRAVQAGHPAAKAALQTLHEKLKTAAQQGDNRAQRLLLQLD